MTTTTSAPAGLPASVQAPLEAHAFSETEREVGGILIGRLREGGAEITAFIPALRATGSATNVTFTHEVWADVLDKVETDYPDQQIVGWYHTHPGFGLFLSEYDLFIHRSFFADERMVALVVDPLIGEAAWFGWIDGDVVKTSTFPTITAAVKRDSELKSAQSQSTSRRSRAAMIASAAAICAGVGGYVWGASATDNSDALAAANSEIASLEQQVQESTSTTGGKKSDGNTAPERGDSPSTPASGGATGSLVFTVRPGDSWWALADFFYGDGEQWTELRQANNDKTLDPGDVIVVPGQEFATAD